MKLLTRIEDKLATEYYFALRVRTKTFRSIRATVKTAKQPASSHIFDFGSQGPLVNRNRSGTSHSEHLHVM